MVVLFPQFFFLLYPQEKLLCRHFEISSSAELKLNLTGKKKWGISSVLCLEILTLSPGTGAYGNLNWKSVARHSVA